MNRNSYVYAYLRTDNTPYYIGKGIGSRWRQSHTVSVPADRSRVIFLKENLSDAEAIDYEIKLIAEYGRKDLGTGILRNQTDGGEGGIPGPLVRKKLSDAKKGKKPNNYGKKYKCKRGFENRSRAKSGANHPMYEKSHTPAARKLISIASKKRWENIPIVTCPHCGFTGKESGSMSRWHFVNCKHRAESHK